MRLALVCAAALLFLAAVLAWRGDGRSAGVDVLDLGTPSPAARALEPPAASGGANAGAASARAGLSLEEVAAPLRVVDAIDGRPLAGAEVRVGGGVAARVVHATGPDGTVDLGATPRDGLLSVFREGYVARRARVGVALSRGEIELRPVCRLDVRIVDGRDTPVSGLEVTYSVVVPDLWTEERARWELVRPFGSTDTAGSVARAGLPRGATVHLWVGEEPFAVDLLADRATTDVEFRVAVAGTVVGRVVDGVGAVVAGALVEWVPYADADPLTTTSRRDGRFAFARLAPGRARIGAELPGVRAREVDVPAGGRLDIGDLVAPVLGRVEGTFEAPVSPFPSPAITTRVVSRGAVVAEGSLDDGGGFDLEAPVGEGVLELTLGRIVLARAPIAVPATGLHVEADESVRLLVIELEGGRPAIVDVDVLRPPAGFRVPERVARIRRIPVRDGRIAIPLAGKDVLGVLVDAGVLGGAYLEDVTAADDARTVTLGFGSLAIDLGDDGPVSEAELRVDGARARVTRRLSAGDTSAELELLLPGPYACALHGPDGRPLGAARANVRVGGPTAVELSGASSARLAGRVVGASREGADVARLSWRESMAYAAAPIGEDGSFVFERLAPGRYTLGVGTLGKLSFELYAGESRELRFERARRVEASLTLEGEPLRGLLRASLATTADEVATEFRVDLVGTSRVAFAAPEGRALLTVECVDAEGAFSAFAEIDSEDVEHASIEVERSHSCATEVTAMR